MADVNFSTADVPGLVKTVYDRTALNALRPELCWVDIVRYEPHMLAMPGNVHTFTFYPDMAAATTALNEITDPEYVAVTPTTKAVTLLEYGNAARSSRKYRGVAFVPAPDRDIAELIGWNAGISQDTLVRNVAVAGTNVTYAGTATAVNTVGTSDTLTGAKVRYVTAKLRGGDARSFRGGSIPGTAYITFIHPDVSVDLRQETGAGGWSEPINNGNDQSRRWEGLIGKYEGQGFIETSRAPFTADASNDAGSTGTIDVYQTITVGAEALAGSHGSENGKLPEFVQGPQVDRLRRHHTFGWYWLGGYVILRDAAIWRVESASSIGTNA